MISAISAYGHQAASTRVRLHDWFSYLGIQPEVYEYVGFADNRPGRLLRHPVDVLAAERHIRRLRTAGSTVLLSREATPFSRGEVEERLLGEADWGVFDFDDALFVDVGGSRRFSMPEVKCARSVRGADVVVAGNDYLANWASDHNSAVRVIPSCIDPNDYRAKSCWAIEGAPRIVWLGSASTERYVADIAPALRQVCQRTGARLHVISAARDSGALRPLQPWTTRTPWSLGSFADELGEADVAIAPLPDTPYARGKCAYKLLQYAATGVPMIGSPVGANAEALSRFDGIAATTLDEWADGLQQLLSESEAGRTNRGLTEMLSVNKHYSFEAWQDDWKRAMGPQ